jgi:hypothetical protein
MKTSLAISALVALMTVSFAQADDSSILASSTASGTITAMVGTTTATSTAGGMLNATVGTATSTATGTLMATVATTTATTTPPINGTSTPPVLSTSSFYPNAFPSDWYLLPGQKLGFNGSGFAPNEAIRIIGEGKDSTTNASGSGTFTINDAFVIPYDWAASTRTFTITGGTSDGNVTPRPITIQIGTFYPQITPSIWWVAHSQGMSVSGSGFAPNEQVELMVNGTEIGRMSADGNGNVNFNFTTPASGSSAMLTAQGLVSGLSSSRTIFLHQ